MAIQFNVEEFLETNLDGKLSDRLIPVPEGEHSAMIGDWKPEQWFSGHEDPKDGRRWIMANIPCLVQDPALQVSLGREILLVKYGINIEVIQDLPGWQIDTTKGKNAALGRFLSGLGLNEEFNRSLKSVFEPLANSGPYLVSVKHSVSKKDGETYANVSSIARY